MAQQTTTDDGQGHASDLTVNVNGTPVTGGVSASSFTVSSTTGFNEFPGRLYVTIP